MRKPTRIVVSCNPEFRGVRRVRFGKNVQFWTSIGGSNLRNGAKYALDLYRTLIEKSHSANQMVQSACAYIRQPEVPKIEIGNR